MGINKKKILLILDLGINANGDENGFFYVKKNHFIIKKGSYTQCKKFIENYNKNQIMQLELPFLCCFIKI